LLRRTAGQKYRWVKQVVVAVPGIIEHRRIVDDACECLAEKPLKIPALHIVRAGQIVACSSNKVAVGVPKSIDRLGFPQSSNDLLFFIVDDRGRGDVAPSDKVFLFVIAADNHRQEKHQRQSKRSEPNFELKAMIPNGSVECTLSPKFSAETSGLEGS
jgi:hypothetical protein